MSKLKKVLCAICIIIILLILTTVLNKIFAANTENQEALISVASNTSTKTTETIRTITGGGANVSAPMYHDELGEVKQYIDESYWKYCMEETAPLPFAAHMTVVKELDYDIRNRRKT